MPNGLNRAGIGDTGIGDTGIEIGSKLEVSRLEMGTVNRLLKFSSVTIRLEGAFIPF